MTAPSATAHRVSGCSDSGTVTGLRWASRTTLISAVALGLAACGTTQSRATDDGAQQIREQLTEMQEVARNSLADHSVTTSGRNVAVYYPEIMDYEVNGHEVTWHLYIRRTGRDPRGLGETTLQVASCIDLQGTATSLKSTTVTCPAEELAQEREHFDVEVDVLK